METLQDREKLLISYSCIAKSVDLRPTMLHIDSFDEFYALVKPHQGWYDRPLNVPRLMLFRADEKVFRKLKAAYEKNDRKTLEKVWQQVKLWEPGI